MLETTPRIIAFTVLHIKIEAYPFMYRLKSAPRLAIEMPKFLVTVIYLDWARAHRGAGLMLGSGKAIT